MKKIYFIFGLFLSFVIMHQSFAMPVYNDDIPQEYINKVRNNQNYNLKQTMPLFDEENAIPVKVYTPEKIKLKYIPVKQTNERVKNIYLEIAPYSQNYNINDKITFLIAEDVIKNGKTYIKKGTEAIGIIRDAQLGFGHLSSPDELQISLFKTKDVNNNSVALYGTVGSEGKNTGLFQILISDIPSLGASIPKNKIYTLYCK